MASRLPTQQSNAAVVGQARQGDVRPSRQQQQHQLLDQQPRKAGPSRGLIEEFLPPAQVVSVGLCGIIKINGQTQCKHYYLMC